MSFPLITVIPSDTSRPIRLSLYNTRPAIVPVLCLSIRQHAAPNPANPFVTPSLRLSLFETMLAHVPAATVRMQSGQRETSVRC